MDSFKDETNETKAENLPKFYNYSSILEKGSLLSFAGTILLLISYCSPYWLQSWADTRSPFLNLGLWSVCFYRFRHPKVQLDRIFHGCYPVWGENLQIISYWMAPGWMIFIQVFATGALSLVLFSQIISVSLLLRSPLQTVIRYERKLLLVASVLNGIPGLMMIITIIVSSEIIQQFKINCLCFRCSPHIALTVNTSFIPTTIMFHGALHLQLHHLFVFSLLHYFISRNMTLLRKEKKKIFRFFTC